MKVLFETSFARDLKKIRNKRLLAQIQQVINQVKSAASVSDVADLKKMQGYDTFYRIRLGDYRIGVDISDEQVIFVRLLHRKDIYRYFP
ncbi:MAG: type II toxin-antitoxin system RelE/ParE family toxin [Anaerolineales bacterium]|nr:type II toxin-antitoxin system RelE/ParE family toxin [Anaerolineales bacterium]MDP2974627.1 type II toxin-antitoxin system RelE/ParE family toxin [Anaerolineales bacterium]MDP3185868.1 type II toxin-antitoxin system RelE/ParE family toxin [Anaerolineales bacterium]